MNPNQEGESGGKGPSAETKKEEPPHHQITMTEESCAARMAQRERQVESLPFRDRKKSGFFDPKP